MSDPGLIMMVREAFPEMPIHLSVQANAVNWATVKFWAANGVERVIVSRELSLEEIEEIREHCPETELEVFVHGALCMAYSGRCLLSGYINKRDPNQGTCTNACRWEYKVEEGKENDAGDIVEKFDPTEAQAVEVQDERLRLLSVVASQLMKLFCCLKLTVQKRRWRRLKMSTALTS